MAYKVIFSDKTQVSIDDEQATKLMAIQSQVKKPDYVNIAGNQYRLSSITKVIKQFSEPVVKQITASKPVHEMPIHGQIQSDYTKELKKEHPRQWDEFCKAGYAHYSKMNKYCDYKTGACYCKNKPITTADVKQVMDFMRS